MKLGAVYQLSILGAILCGANCFATAPASDSPTAPPPSILSSAANLSAEDGSVPALLARVRAANKDLYSSLQSFVCKEQIDRFEGPLTGEHARHIDTVTAKVSFENGVEHYTDILQDYRPRTNIESVSGAWSQGDFGTLLQQTQILLDVLPVEFKAYGNMDGSPAAIYSLNISEQNSPWVLDVEHHHYRIPFRTEVWVSQTTGRIMKVERISLAIPQRVRISEMRWGVTLQTIQLDQKSWLLPKTGNYAVVYKATGRREWNQLTFSEYHRYGSQVALRFE